MRVGPKLSLSKFRFSQGHFGAMLRCVTLVALVGMAQCFFAPTLPVMSLRGSNTRLRVTMQQTGGSRKASWQDVAEKLADPFVNPLDKVSLAADLLAMREEVVSSISKVIYLPFKFIRKAKNRRGDIRLFLQRVFIQYPAQMNSPGRFRASTRFPCCQTNYELVN